MDVSVTPQAFAGYLAGFCLRCRVIGVVPGLPAAQRAHVLEGVDLVVTDEVLAELLANEPIELTAVADQDAIRQRDLHERQHGPAEGHRLHLPRPLTPNGKPDKKAMVALLEG
jgi:hypothetical protein